MMRICLSILLSVCLGTTAFAQQSLLPSNLISTQSSNGRLNVSANLSNLEQHLAETLARTYANQNCGDRVTADSVDLASTGAGAALTARVTMTRWQCTSLNKPVCKGFVCRKETQEFRSKVYEASFPLVLDITPDTSKRGALQFIISPRQTSGISKAFLGQVALYENASVAFQSAVSSSLNQISRDIASGLNNPRAFNAFNPRTTRFSTGPTGNVILNLQLQSR